MKREGLFITIEGPDGAGKSTQVEFIKKYFRDRNADVIFTREPGGNVISEKIREIILDREHKAMSPVTEAFLYAASRAQLVDEVIAPALGSGRIVVCDRFVDSSIAYQGYGRNLGDMVAEINGFAVREYMPDLTVLLTVDADRGIRRVTETRACEKDRMEEEKIEFHRAVCRGYSALAEEFPDRIFSIDGSMSIEEVSRAIEAKLDEVMEVFQGASAAEGGKA